MTLAEAAARIGRKVTYRDYGRDPETGVITSVSEHFVFVRYGGDKTSRATHPEALAAHLSYDEAVALLPDGRVHTFVNPAGMLVGADWDREDIYELLRSGRPELSGEQATAWGHGIVAFREAGPVFIATRLARS
jgi:hypothetical protein